MKLYFEERQTFNQWWLWLILGTVTLGVNVVIIHGIVQQVIVGIPWGSKPLSDEALVILGVVVLTVSTGLSLLFISTSMEVRIDRRAIEYRYKPWISEWRRIEREAIRGCSQRRNYLGHGVKRSLDGTRIFSVSGFDGIEVTLASGSKIFFGTQLPSEFSSAVDRMVKSNAI